MSRVRTAAAWIGKGVVGLLAAALLALAAVYGSTTWTFRSQWSPAVATPEIPTGEADAIERGKHVLVTRGCRDCHGRDLGGSTVIDSVAMGTIQGPNLTPGRGGIPDAYDAEDWVRAIRHGLAPDGTPLLFMPSHEYDSLGERDLAALVAYLESVPPVDGSQAEPAPGPLARLLYVAGSLPVLVPAERIDHDAPLPETPEVGPTATYGEYLASSCSGCHGSGFSGGPIPGMPPSFPPAPNLTPHESGIADWSRSDWERALTKGVTPEGDVMPKKYMPWNTTRAMTRTERTALFEFFKSLDPQRTGER